MLKAFHIRHWRWIEAITVIESKNQVVIWGGTTESDIESLFTFQNNLDDEPQTRMNAPCQHGVKALITVVQNGKELLAVPCWCCKAIKLVNMETKQVTCVFESPAYRPLSNCSGPNGSFFVASLSGHIQQFDSPFTATNACNFTDVKYIVEYMCYLPTPHNTLVVSYQSELRAVSLLDGHEVWNQNCNGFKPDCLLYYPQEDVLLVNVYLEPQIRVVNPSDRSMIQTIKIPDIYVIHRMCLCNDQIVMLHWPGEYCPRALLSYYSLKRIV